MGSEFANWREVMENETASSLCAMGAAGKAAGCNLSVTTVLSSGTQRCDWDELIKAAGQPGLACFHPHPAFPRGSRILQPGKRAASGESTDPWPVAGTRYPPPLASWSSPYGCTPCCLLAPTWQLPSSELTGTSPVGSLCALQLPGFHL